LIRASTSYHIKKEDVDGRDKPGHDEQQIHFEADEKGVNTRCF
jgi:hypothetical protein